MAETKKKATIRDVARESGCSIATVSRVINDVNMYYSQETRDKVMEAVQKLNYTPNLNAKGLKESRSFNIVYLVPQMDEYYVNILNVMQEIANGKGYSIFILNSNYSEEQEEKHIRHILEKQYDGVIIATGLLNTKYSSKMDELFSGIPTVILEGTCTESKVPAVYVNVRQLCCQAVEKLIELGHKRIAYVSAPCIFQTLIERYYGYQDALKAHQIPLDESLVFFEEGLGKTDFKQCYSVMDRILQRKDITALLVNSDWAALVASSIIQEKGGRVPEDISIIGFDNVAFTEYVVPQISTISQGSQTVGKIGIMKLLDMIEGKEVTNTLVEGELIVRQSIGVVPNNDIGE